MQAVLTVLVVIAGATGCVTPYQRHGFTGGYHDTEVSPGLHRIRVNGNGFTGVATLEEYFHRRASEICLAKGVDAYDYRIDSGVEVGPGHVSISKNKLTGDTVIRENSGVAKGWVSGFVVCVPGGPRKAYVPPPEPPEPVRPASGRGMSFGE